MRINHLTSVICFLLLGICSIAQQVPDTAYSPSPFQPRYQRAKGPKVLIDEAHFNFHTATGGYRVFCKVLEKDGYRTGRWTQRFDQASLDSVGILVVANALHESNTQNWDMPNPSAFTKEEITRLNDWVKKGGSLFLIADHMPFAGAAAGLAASFGFKFLNGFALNENNNDGDVFTKSRGLADHPLINTDTIVSFMGQAFEIPEDAISLLTIDAQFTVMITEKAWVFDKDTKRLPGAGLSQIAILQYGKGRLVVSGEAAMFTAQRNGAIPAGMNQAKAKNNYKLLLNLIHWLDVKYN